MKLGKRGQMGGAVLVTIIAIILIVGVGIPVAQDVITDANLTGLSATIVAFVPIFMAVGALIVSTRVMGRG
jgi:protein-S-isoprenylcysteine O-methyltransferase Ste14